MGPIKTGYGPERTKKSSTTFMRKILKLLSISVEKYLQINNKFITIIDIILITFKKEIMKSVTFTTFS